MVSPLSETWKNPGNMCVFKRYMAINFAYRRKLFDEVGFRCAKIFAREVENEKAPLLGL
jgi:hypothetical protein